jgi:hypothetical protein
MVGIGPNSFTLFKNLFFFGEAAKQILLKKMFSQNGGKHSI